MRIAMSVEYNGSGYSGWQSQPHAPSVQQVVEDALSIVADHAVAVVCAGRTDAGVHAWSQIIHFDTGAERSERSWVLGANANLPRDVSIHWAQPVPETFHARFSAVARSYRYIICNRWVRSGLQDQRATWVHAPLNEQDMHAAAQLFVGTHDFTSFRALACQAKSPVRTIHEFTVARQGELVIVDVTANAFLHHMVRNLVGVLISIGKGEQPIDWARAVLERRDRARGGVTAPADGLYFVNAHYPPEFALPKSHKHLPEPGQPGLVK